MNFIVKSFFSWECSISDFQNFILMHFVDHLQATILFSPMLCFEYISVLGVFTIDFMKVMHVFLPSILIGQ